MKFLNKEWLKAALIRAAKTFIQSVTSILSTAVVLSDVNILLILNTAGLAAIVSIITSLAGLPELEAGNANKVQAIAIRALKTVAQTALSYVATMTLVSEVDWLKVFSASVLAGIVSVGMNFQADKLPEVELINKK